MAQVLKKKKPTPRVKARKVNSKKPQKPASASVAPSSTQSNAASRSPVKFICGEEDLIGEKVVEVVTDKRNTAVTEGTGTLTPCMSL